MSTAKTVFVTLVLCAAVGCGEDEAASGVRGAGAGGAKAGKAKKEASRRGDPNADDEDFVDPGPPRPPVALDSKSFQRRRDPFLSFVASDEPLPEPPATSVRAERRVKMASYAFEDLKLITIVGGRIAPRALFLASDGKSKTIKQGEYFSSSEVKLAAVNRDYVEIEVVDDDLGSSLNLQRGERRAIYLRTD